MSAPTSGSSGSSSSSSSSASPVPGYYPDPSLPHYIRYWNGSAWVPGTSRPAPAEPEDVRPAPSSGSVPPAAPAPVPPPAPAVPGPPVAARLPRQGVDESGPMFLDEDPLAPQAQTPAPVWPVATPPGQGLPPISWGTSAPAAESPAPQPAPPLSVPPLSVPPRSGPSVPPQTGSPSGAGSRPAPVPGPQPIRPGPQSGAGSPAAARPGQAAAGPATPWAAQVHDLAQHGQGPGQRQGQAPPAAEPVVPWRPPVADPFAGALSLERPGGLVRRFAARVIDTVVGAVVVGAAAVPLGSAAYHHAKDKVDAAKLTGETVKVWLIDGTTGAEIAAVVVVAIVAGLLLEVLPTARWGRTLGKKLVGLRVLDIEAHQPPDFGASLRRWLTRTLLDLLAIGVVGLAWCLFDRPWKQCWHDKASRTFVAGG